MKKRNKSVFLLIAALYTAGLLFHDRASAADKNTPPPKNDPAAENSSWPLYSNGLYYKNLAEEDLQSSKSSEYLKKAVEYFLQALKEGKSLDRIYFQLSDCYYYLYDFSQSITCAKKSIEINRKDIKPYNRLYNIYMRLRNHEKAAEILEEYVTVEPDNVYIHYVLAEHYINNMRDIKKSIQAFEKVIRASGRGAVEDYYKENALYSLGYIYYHQGEKDRATQLFEKTLELNRENHRALYMLIMIYMDTYQLDKTKNYARQYLKKYPHNTKVNAAMGRATYLQNSPGAGTYLRKAGESKSIDGIIARALFDESLKRDEEAKKILESAIKIRPKFASLHIALGNINARNKEGEAAFNEYLTAGVLLYKKNLYREATYYLNQALTFKKDIAGIYYYLGRTYEDSESLSLAILNYKTAEKISPNIDLVLHIGYLYGVKKDYNEALVHFSKAIEMEPENSKPYFFTGLISIWKKEYSEAEIHIKKAISLEEKSDTYYFYLAVIMEKQDRFDEAVLSLEQAIKHNPKSARAYNYLGYLYADRGINIDESHSLITRALEIEPENGAYIDSLGWVYYKKGDYQKALVQLLKAEELLYNSESPDPVVFDHIGDTYKKMGNIKKALKYWKKSLEYEDNRKIEKKIQDHTE